MEDLMKAHIESSYTTKWEELVKFHIWMESIKIGDWVKQGDSVGKLVKVVEDGFILDNESEVVSIHGISPPTNEDIYHEKEMRWWNSNDRNVWELREKDRIKSKKSSNERIIVCVEEDYVYTADGVQIPKSIVIDKFEVTHFNN